MSKSVIKGKSKQMEGKARAAKGKLEHNRKEQLKGDIKQGEGKVEEAVGKAERKLKRK